MDKLAEARARLKALTDALAALMTKAATTAEEMKAISDNVDAIEAEERNIATLERVEAAQARAAKPANQVIPAAAERGLGTPALIDGAREPELDAQKQMSTLAAGLLKAKANEMPTGAAIDLIREAGYGKFAGQIERAFGIQERTVTIGGSVANTGTAASLGATIPASLAGPFVEILRPEVTFLQANPRRVQFVNGQFNQPRGVGSATAGYVGEGQKKPVGQPTFDAAGMSPKKLAGIVLITDEARAWSVMAIEEYIREDMRSVMSNTWDLQAYFGTGSAVAPTGIFNTSGITTVTATFADATAPTLPELDVAATKMILSLTNANLPMNPRWAWIMDYRTWSYLSTVRTNGDGDGNLAYPELANKTWKGIRILVSTAFPINGGTGTDEAKLALVDFSQILYGEDEGLVVKAATEASVDVAGTLVHLWQQNVYGILMEMRHNWMVQRPKAIAVLAGVRWGA